MKSITEKLHENLIYEVKEKVYTRDIEGVTDFCNDVLGGDNWTVNKDLSVTIDNGPSNRYDLSFSFPNNVTRIPDFIKFKGRDITIAITGGPYNKNLEDFKLDFDGTLSMVMINNLSKIKNITINNTQIETIYIDKCNKLESINLTGSEILKDICVRKNKSLKDFKAPKLGAKIQTYKIDNPIYSDDMVIRDGTRYKIGEKGKLIEI